MFPMQIRFVLVLSLWLCLSLFVPSVTAAGIVNRHDGFLMLWHSIGRVSKKTNEKPYADVPKTDVGFLEITYAKSRGILNDAVDHFRPTEPLSTADALLLLFRIRSVERLKKDGTSDFMTLPSPADIPALAKKYAINVDNEAASITEEDLLSLMRKIDSSLLKEEHEVSFYSEKFHGKGTAFGETFDMNAPTAAHRTFPHNTLVRVTNKANGKSIVVRVNDRGPFIAGRDMDLSLHSFTQIAERSVGIINATFERLGDASLVLRCHDDRYQRRITKDVVLNPGIPHSLPLGATLSLSSKEFFVVREVTYPDGTNLGMQRWVGPGSGYVLTPSTTGSYRFLLGTKTGRQRTMTMEVVACPG